MFDRPILCHRLFFALIPPLELARRMVEAAAVSRCRPMLPERVHLTLFIVEDLPRLDPLLVAALRAVGDQVTAPPVAISLDRLSGGYRSIALRPGHGDPALVALHREVTGLAAARGIAKRHDHRFSPHLTLGYDNPAPWSERVAPVGWTADALVLIHSRVGQTRHEEIGRWPLVGAPAGQLSLF